MIVKYKGKNSITERYIKGVEAINWPSQVLVYLPPNHQLVTIVKKDCEYIYIEGELIHEG